MQRSVLAAILLLAGFTNAQDCFYRRGGLELDLAQFQGREFHYTGNNGHYFYTPCQSTLTCERGGVTRMAMADYYPNGVNECHDVAEWNAVTQPFFNIGIGSWIFNYTGETCPDQTLQVNRSTTIVWNCKEDASSPYISDVYHYDDCNDWMQIEWEGACQEAPPNNEECVFKSGLLGGRDLNLSTIKGISYSYTDTNDHQWNFSPCANKFSCENEHGTHEVMADIDDTTGQCAKYFAEWSGDDYPFFDRTVIGQDYWEFFWMNGQSCDEGGPTEFLTARYYCSNSSTTFIRYAGPSGPPCQYQYDIDSPLACEQDENGKPIYSHLLKDQKKF